MRKFLLPIYIIFSLKLSAQFDPEKIKLGIHSGFSFFVQEDLKSINQEFKKQLPFETEIIDDFKPVLYFGGYSQYELLNRFALGPVYEYHYTGSRLGARDYSGIFSFDQYIKSHQIGMKFSYSLITELQKAFIFELNTGINFTRWKTDSKLEIGEDGEFLQQDKDNFTGKSWNVTPAIKYIYRITTPVSLFGNLAYSFDLARKYTYEEDKSLDITKAPRWSGLKVSIGVEF